MAPPACPPQYFGALRRTMRAVSLAVRRAGTLLRTLTRSGRGGHVERAAAEAVAANPLPVHGDGPPVAEAFDSFKSDVDKSSPKLEGGPWGAAPPVRRAGCHGFSMGRCCHSASSCRGLMG